ncbi:hypothetical protein DXG01_001228 [Tephrocybe rancida]|nr:hypothetical protein DXG01_001228 [Tephrocybe rancida]
MRFGLTQRNIHRIEDMLMDVSHPESPAYGQHWTPSRVLDTFAPSGDTITAVTNWLADAGIARERLRLSVSKGWIELNATVQEMESLLKTEYHVYGHSDTSDEQISCPSYSVPAHVQPHIDVIKPTVHFNHRPVSNRLDKRGMNLGAPSVTRGPKRSNKKIKTSPSLANCDEMITPDCLRALYSVDYTPVATHKNTYGIVEFTPQAFLQGDLDLFFRNFSPSLVGVKPESVLIDGAIVQTTNQSFDFNGESDLDLEYAMALTNPQPITLLQTGDIVEGAGFDNWLDAVDKSFCTFEGGDDPDQDLNLVVSSRRPTWSPSPMAKTNLRLRQRLHADSVLSTPSSGDDGVAGNGDQPVRRNGTVFNPSFPSEQRKSTQDLQSTIPKVPANKSYFLEEGFQISSRFVSCSVPREIADSIVGFPPIKPKL